MKKLYVKYYFLKKSYNNINNLLDIDLFKSIF